MVQIFSAVLSAFGFHLVSICLISKGESMFSVENYSSTRTNIAPTLSLPYHLMRLLWFVYINENTKIQQEPLSVYRPGYTTLMSWK